MLGSISWRSILMTHWVFKLTSSGEGLYFLHQLQLRWLLVCRHLPVGFKNILDQ
jgi:hypothetical protein